MKSDGVVRTHTRETMTKLGYMGLIPFVAGLFVSLTGSTLFGLSGEALFITYSVVILSFCRASYGVVALKTLKIHGAIKR